MPAVARDPARSRGGKGAGAPKSRARPRAVQAAYAPVKLNGAAAADIDPHLALGAAGAVLAAGLVLALATGGRGHRLAAGIAHAADSQAAALGFKVTRVELIGASADSRGDLIAQAGVSAGTPILGLDLTEVRRKVEQAGWVKRVRVMRLLPDTLAIAVEERPRLAVWQLHGRLAVVDAEGHPIPEADPGRFPDLPLIVGEGAPEAAGKVLPLVRQRPALASRLEALVRVDGRRWDLRLKDGGLIALPAEGEEAALIRFDQLEARDRVLELGFARLDLRDPQTAALRPRTSGPPPAAAQGQ